MKLKQRVKKKRKKEKKRKRKKKEFFLFFSIYKVPAGDNKTSNGRENVMNVSFNCFNSDLLTWLYCGPLAF